MRASNWQDVVLLTCLLGSSALREGLAFVLGPTTTTTTTPVRPPTTCQPPSHQRSPRSTRLYSARTGKSSKKEGADEEPVDPKAADTLPGYDSWLESRKDEIDVSILYDEEELENRRRDSFRIEKYMEVMGRAKVGEDHPRIALAKEAVLSKPVERLTHGMLYRKLGKSDLLVSEVCLGCMTWGEQTTEEQAHQQLHLAFDEYNVNFVDTAEIYPVPAMEDTWGNTDRILGKWLKKRKRDEVVVATKVTGYSEMLPWIRKSGGTVRVSPQQITESVEGSLQRLGIDHIDLLQIHWPDRYSNLFGVGQYDVKKERDEISIEDQLQALGKLVKQGKVRYIGLSNETPYGVMKFLEVARQLGLPEIVSVQNGYNLLSRYDIEMGMSEVCSKNHENLAVLAYSPLAGGALTGKYLFRGRADGARMNRYPGYMARYRTLECVECTFELKKIAEKYGFTMVQLAIGWVASQPSVTSTLFGATSVDQLRENLNALNTPLFTEVRNDLQEVFVKYRDPSRMIIKILEGGDMAT